MTSINVGNVSFSEEEINNLKADGGVSSKTLSNSPKGVVSHHPTINRVDCNQAPTGNSQWAAQAPRITGQQRVTKPRVRGQEDASLVTHPDMSRANSNHEAEILRLEQEQARADAEADELRSFMDPKKLRSELEYLQRTVRRLEKNLKAVLKEQDDA